MKLFVGFLSLTTASHFRAASLQYDWTPSGLMVTRTMGWRRLASGYSGGCTQADIDNNVPAVVYTYEGIIDNSPAQETVPFYNTTYIVQNIEDSASLDPNSHYCFGRITELSPYTGPGPFTQSASSCCTITMTFDDGFSGTGSYIYTATVNDSTNNSPFFESPPLWRILDGCGEQQLFLNPTDADGDTIRCRWSTVDEAGFMAHNDNLKQFLLDEENCSITYRPEYDQVGVGAKPVAIQVEDFDIDGNMMSSVPAQFVGLVFIPDLSPTTRNAGLIFAGLFSDEDDHDHVSGRRRRRQTTPNYCTPPEFIGVTPGAGSHIKHTMPATFTIAFEAVTTDADGNKSHDDLDKIQFNKPEGMTCTTLVNGEAECTWPATKDDIGEFPLCATVFDIYGRESVRHCVTFELTLSAADAKDTAEEAADDMKKLLAGLRRNKKFGRRMKKLTAMLNSYTENCVNNFHRSQWSSKNMNFNTWASEYVASTDRCAQSKNVADGLRRWAWNFACKDGFTRRQTRKWAIILSKLPNKYC